MKMTSPWVPDCAQSLHHNYRLFTNGPMSVLTVAIGLLGVKKHE